MIADIRGWGRLTGTGGLGLSPIAAVQIQRQRGTLMAAAPELLRACEAVLATAKVEDDPATIRLVAAAIAKATGGES